MDILFQIDAPHFCAGAVMSEGKVIEIAPIIRYMKGWSESKIQSYCKKKNWKYSEMVIGDDLMEF
jgi:hypothetical protein